MTGTHEHVRPTDTTCCIRCGQQMTPFNRFRICKRAPDVGLCEPPHPYGDWLPSITVRQGSSTHVSQCERSNPSVWLPSDLPCSCGPTTRVLHSDGPSDG